MATVFHTNYRTNPPTRTQYEVPDRVCPWRHEAEAEYKTACEAYQILVGPLPGRDCSHHQLSKRRKKVLRWFAEWQKRKAA